MLKESLIENNSILLNQRAADWKAAIKLGTDLLEKSGLAMPHSRPEEGVIKTSFALVTLAEPITFDGEDEPVSVLVTLAGSDSDKHMEGLMEITQVLDDPDSDTGVDLAKILRCQTKEDVYAVIDQALAG